MKDTNRLTRRNFIARTGTALAGAMIAAPFVATSAQPLQAVTKTAWGWGAYPIC